MRFQIGAFFPTRDMPADHVAIRAWAQAAEAIGFHFIEVSDHVLGADRAALPDFQGPYDVNDAFRETFVTLSYIATESRSFLPDYCPVCARGWMDRNWTDSPEPVLYQSWMQAAR